MITTLVQKQKKFLRKTLGRPKGNGFIQANFVAFFLQENWESLGIFFCFSNVNLTSFAIFWEIFTKFSISQNWRKKKIPCPRTLSRPLFGHPNFCSLHARIAKNTIK